MPYIALLSIYALIVQVVTATLAGLGRMDLSNYAETIRRIVLVLVVVPLLYFGQGLKSLLIATACSHLVKHLLSLLLIRRIVQFRLMRLGNISGYCFKRLLDIGLGLFGGSVVQMVGIPFNKFMLVRFAGVESLPVFDIAWQGAMQIRNVMEIAFRALMPEVSRIASEMSINAIRRIQSLMRRAVRLILVGGAPLFIVLFLTSNILLKLWLRESFVHTLPPAFRIMLLASFINLLSVPAYYFLMGLGKIRYVFMFPFITWLSNGILVLIVCLYLRMFSPFIAGACLVISWTAATCYLICTYRMVIRHYAKTTLSIDLRNVSCAH